MLWTRLRREERERKKRRDGSESQDSCSLLLPLPSPGEVSRFCVFLLLRLLLPLSPRPCSATRTAHPLLVVAVIHRRNVAKVGGSAIYSSSSISVVRKLKISCDQLLTDTHPPLRCDSTCQFRDRTVSDKRTPHPHFCARCSRC